MSSLPVRAEQREVCHVETVLVPYDDGGDNYTPSISQEELAKLQGGGWDDPVTGKFWRDGVPNHPGLPGVVTVSRRTDPPAEVPIPAAGVLFASAAIASVVFATIKGRRG